AGDRRVVPQVADRHIAANGAVGRLLTDVERGVATGAPDKVVRQTRRGRTVDRTSGHATQRVAIAAFRADIATDLQARIRAGDVEEPRPVQATNLHVLHWCVACPGAAGALQTFRWMPSAVRRRKDELELRGRPRCRANAEGALRNGF